MALPTPEPAVDPLSDDVPDRDDGTGELRDVVVGTDGSDCALGAVRWAAREAARRGVPLRIVHAAEYLGRQNSAETPSPELPTARRIAAKAYTIARQTAPGLDASTDVVAADPATALLAAAAQGALIVLGSSTTGAADELVFAPVALRVSARSPRPVVVVPRLRGHTDATRPVVGVLGIGDPEDDEAVADFAAEVARHSAVGLSLIQTRAPRRGASPESEDGSGAWQRRFPDLAVTTAALNGATRTQLLAAASPAPLIVLSAGRDSTLHRSPDGAHRWLMRHCTSPMALVPPSGGRRHDGGGSTPSD